MQRAALERRRTVRQWRKRSEFEEALTPGRFRKGRRAQGCPRPCTACRSRKEFPSRQEERVEVTFREQVVEVLRGA